MGSFSDDLRSGQEKRRERRKKERQEKWRKIQEYEQIYFGSSNKSRRSTLVNVIDEKSNYHVHAEECSEDCDEEEWPYSDDFDWIGDHHYEKINWEE